LRGYAAAKPAQRWPPPTCATADLHHRLPLPPFAAATDFPLPPIDALPTHPAPALPTDLPPTLWPTLLALLAALAVGLVIGLERGWRDRALAAGSRVAGLRTFALLGLLGGVLGTLAGVAGPWPLAAGLLGVALLAAQGYRESVRVSGSLSATSAIAQLLTCALGALATLGMPVVAVACAVLVAVLLDLRSTLHRWLQLIQRSELNAGLQMLVLSLVVLPLLPDASYAGFAALNPYRLWWAVVLVAGLSLCGHVAMRMAGAQRGALWTGLLGGLASSTAATLAIARKVRGHGPLLEPGTAGALAACAVMFCRIAVIVLALAPALGLRLLAPLLAAALVLLGAALLHWRRRDRSDDAAAATGAEARPFDLTVALGFGLYLAVTAVLLELAQRWFGDSALHALALLAGLADVDAVTISLARMQAAGAMPQAVASLAIGLAVLSNMVAKAVMAWTAGGQAFGRAVAVGYAMALLAGGAVLVALVAWD
jgi:uncharacterized membrane protein (DUF4010 family)